MEMKLKLSALSLSLFSLIAVNSAFAISVNGTVTANAVVTDQEARATIGNTQPVTLMRLGFSKDELRTLNTFRKDVAKRVNKRDNSLPDSADVGMNDTPVLNQGMHGSCVTFATTGAFDALIGKGNYVSQLCSLELGSYLEENAYTYSGWDGSFGPLVIDQLLLNGVVSMDTQKTKGCAGVKVYPTNSPSTGKTMTMSQYHKLSENINSIFYWEPMLSEYQFEYNSTDHEADPENVLNAVKKELAVKRQGRESRITFGTIIPVNMCDVGACGSYRAKSDTWTLTKSMQRDFDPSELGGHEMIIIGYDDNAVVTDSEGGSNQGVLILRNSWGKLAGDAGNYYMTYDFFKRFVMEVQRVVKINRQQ
jgi:hypothetical protein